MLWGCGDQIKQIFIAHVQGVLLCGGVLYLVRSPDGWTFFERWIGVLEGLLDGWFGHFKGGWSSIS